MPITATEIVYRLSNSSATAGNQLAGTAASSLGKYVSTTVMTDNSVGNLFDNVTGDENAAGAASTEYRCFFVHNAHATLTWTNVVAWISADVAGGAASAIGVDPTAASALASGTAQAATIASETTAPTGVTFFTGTAIDTKAEGISLGSIGPGQVKAIWVRRTPANTGAVSNDGLTIQTEGDTEA